MKEITQTEIVAPYGNCYAACIASIFEIPLEYLPAQTKMSDEEVIAKAKADGRQLSSYYSDAGLAKELRSGDWHDMWNRWFKENNLTPIRLDYNFYGVGDKYNRHKFGTFHILSGLSPRTKYETDHTKMRYHSVVGKNGRIVWDPHPSREGLASIDEIELIVPTDPSIPILENKFPEGRIVIPQKSGGGDIPVK